MFVKFSPRSLLAAFAMLILTVSTASAFPARVVRDTQLHVGPGFNFGVIDIMPAGSVVEVGECANGWCETDWLDYEGFASEAVLDFAAYAPGYVVPRVAVVPRYYYDPYGYGYYPRKYRKHRKYRNHRKHRRVNRYVAPQHRVIRKSVKQRHKSKRRVTRRYTKPRLYKKKRRAARRYTPARRAQRYTKPRRHARRAHSRVRARAAPRRRSANRGQNRQVRRANRGAGQQMWRQRRGRR